MIFDFSARFAPFSEREEGEGGGRGRISQGEGEGERERERGKGGGGEGGGGELFLTPFPPNGPKRAEKSRFHRVFIPTF